MELSEILNIILGGGLIGTAVSIVTLRSTARRAKAEAVKAEADAETVRMDNSERATRILVENIVKPLKEELNETRKYLEASKREMARLRKAIDAANRCRHHDDCPVLSGLREQSKDHDHERGVERGKGQHGDGAAQGDSRTDSDVRGLSDAEERQSP